MIAVAIMKFQGDSSLLRNCARATATVMLSGVDSNMRRLHGAASSSEDARLAIEMFCYSVRKQIAAMIAVLGGVDMVVFTGGIGENDEVVRAMTCEGLSWAGIGQPEQLSWTVRETVSGDNVCVLPSQEDEQIARHTWAIQKKSFR